MRGFRIGLASATFSVILVWASPGLPVSRSSDAPVRGGAELHRLVDLDHALRRALHAEERRLLSGCEFESIRSRLIQIHSGAGGAIERLREFHRDGGFRSGGLAISEILLQRLAVLREEAHRDTALAEVLGVLHRQALDGSRDARQKIDQIISTHPAPPACLTRELDERMQKAPGGAAVRRQLPSRR
jgi:hypothetical protein